MRIRRGFIRTRIARSGTGAANARDRGALAIEFAALTALAAFIVAAVVALPSLRTVGSWTASSVDKILDTKDDVATTGGGGGPIDIAGAPSEKAKQAVQYALAQRGKPYLYGAPGYSRGASDPSSYDCSSLVQWAYGRLGINLPRVSHDQFFSSSSRVPMNDLKPGDLLFFNTHDGDAPPSHVGMYIGNGQMVHAPHTGDVVRVVPFNSYWKAPGTWMGATRPTAK